jgi:hypothetical protein
MKVPEQSRVWCCPTSVFLHLHLHVMGPIPSDDGIKRYTPTLSALIEFHRRGGQMSGKPSPSLRGAEILVAQQEAFSISCCAARISASCGLRNLDHAKSRYGRHISYLKGCDDFKCSGVSHASPVLPFCVPWKYGNWEAIR